MNTGHFCDFSKAQIPHLQNKEETFSPILGHCVRSSLELLQLFCDHEETKMKIKSRAEEGGFGGEGDLPEKSGKFSVVWGSMR